MVKLFNFIKNIFSNSERFTVIIYGEDEEQAIFKLKIWVNNIKIDTIQLRKDGGVKEYLVTGTCPYKEIHNLNKITETTRWGVEKWS